MASSKLMLHSGAHAATEAQVYDAATPQATETWQPIAHGTLLASVERHVQASGWKVEDKVYALQYDGARMFALFTLLGAQAEAERDYQLTLGIRNSHDKMFPAGLAVGSRVFICDNLAFSAEIAVMRRHTRFIMRDLDKLVATAIGKVGEHRVAQATRIAAYKDTKVDNIAAHDLAIRAVDSMVIPNRALPDVLKHWRQPAHVEFAGRNAWSLFNAFTSAMKDINPMELAPRTTRLHGLLDSASGIIIQPSLN